MTQKLKLRFIIKITLKSTQFKKNLLFKKKITDIDLYIGWLKKTDTHNTQCIYTQEETILTFTWLNIYHIQRWQY
jgi:hypothetical protein